MSGKRKKVKSRRSDNEPYDDQETLEEIKETEDSFMKVLSPVEPYIMMIQSVLVWEDPKYTAAMLVIVNILFWYLLFN